MTCHSKISGSDCIVDFFHNTIPHFGHPPIKSVTGAFLKVSPKTSSTWNALAKYRFFDINESNRPSSVRAEYLSSISLTLCSHMDKSAHAIEMSTQTLPDYQSFNPNFTGGGMKQIYISRTSEMSALALQAKCIPSGAASTRSRFAQYGQNIKINLLT